MLFNFIDFLLNFSNNIAFKFPIDRWSNQSLVFNCIQTNRINLKSKNSIFIHHWLNTSFELTS